jgi:hypothetical protein
MRVAADGRRRPDLDPVFLDGLTAAMLDADGERKLFVLLLPYGRILPHDGETFMPLKTECPNCGLSGNTLESTAGKMVRCPKCGTKFRIQANAAEFAEIEPEQSASIPKWLLAMLIACGSIVALIVVTFIAIILVNRASEQALLKDPILNPDNSEFTAEELHRIHHNDYRGMVATAYTDKMVSLMIKDVIVKGYLQGPITQDSLIIGETETGFGISAEPGGTVLVWINSAKAEGDRGKIEAANHTICRIKGSCQGYIRLHRQVVLGECSVVP